MIEIAVTAFTVGLLGGVVASIVRDEWRHRPPVVYDHQRRRWRSARLVMRDRSHR